MPLTIKIPGVDFYDSDSGRFVTTKDTDITLEHSLLSISKWEAKWHKPFLSKDEKTPEENLDYIRCMCITKNVDPKVFLAIDLKAQKRIADYIADPMTATTINNRSKKAPSKEIVTSELIYFWMANFSIPFEPCEKWHLNRLMMLIDIAAIKNSPPKKMSKAETMRQNHALNAARRAQHHTRG